MNDIILGKSIGTTLVDHSRNVSLVSEYIARNILSVTNERILEVIRIGGLLHDIGKATDDFQKVLKGKLKKTRYKFRHNEIGGAIVQKYVKPPKTIPIEYISNIVYWHHGISNQMGKYYYEDVLDNISPVEIETIKKVIIELLGDDYLLSEPRFNGEDTIKTPKFYYDDKDRDFNNAEMSIIRSCIISGDQIMSMIEEETEAEITINNENIKTILDPIINKIIEKENKYVLDKSPYPSEERFNNQYQIASSRGQTIIVKAPCGFGKTMIGLIRASLSTRKTIWVCPRNVVSNSVYFSILQELQAFNFDISVELYLSGKRTFSTHNNEEFSSDIIVTNIDNFLSPSTNDKISDRLFLIHSANVVFDEYHEFISNSAYFAGFINIMRARHRYTNSQTILLSATPSRINYMWDSIERTTCVLPNDTEHYPAIHNKKYLIRVQTGLIYDKKGSDLIIKNSISNAQLLKDSFSDSLLYHSEFTDSDRDEKFNKLMSEYGKSTNRLMNKQTVVATIIARASFDISFHHIYESCMSPQSTIQSIGRCDRFGDYDEESVVTICRPSINDRSERAVIQLLYNEDLMELWYQTILPYNNCRLTLDELYVIYNNHEIKHEDRIKKEFYNVCHRNSFEQLSTIYPIKFNNDLPKTKIKTAGSNKLRTLGSEIFFMVPHYNNKNQYVGPFTWSIRASIDEDFNENDRVLRRMLGSMKTIMKNPPDGIDYTKILETKRITIDEVRRYGRKSNTPYIRYDKVYHPIYGLINEEFLEKNFKHK